MEEDIKKPFDSHSTSSGQAAQGGEEVKNNELDECKQKCDEYLNNWKRAAADLINYKKGELERAGMLVKYAKEDVILNILPILDSIELAQQNIPEEIRSNAWSEGFLQIKKQIEEFLKKEGIEEIKTVGQPFNPETMESLGETTHSQYPIPNTVVEELQKGYKMEEKIIRPAKVKVTK